MRTIKSQFFKIIYIYIFLVLISISFVVVLFWNFAERNVIFSIQRQFENMLLDVNTQLNEIRNFYQIQNPISSSVSYYYEQNNRKINKNYLIDVRPFLNDIFESSYGLKKRINYFMFIHENGQMLAEFKNMVETYYKDLKNLNGTDLFKKIQNHNTFLYGKDKKFYIVKKMTHDKGVSVKGVHYIVCNFDTLNFVGLKDALSISIKKFEKSLPLFKINLIENINENLCIKFGNNFILNKKVFEKTKNRHYFSFKTKNELTDFNFIMVIPKKSIHKYLFKFNALIVIITLVPIVLLFILFFRQFKKIAGSFKKINAEIKNKKTKIEENFYHKDFNDLVFFFNSLQKKVHENIKLAAIGKTTSMLAHDVRKPFSQIKSVLNMFETLKNNPEMLQKAVDSIDKATRNVESMIEDIMDFSREVKIKTKPESLIEILDFSIRQSVQGIDSFDIKFVYDINHSKKPFADIHTISWAFINIISNGIEAIISKKNKLKGYIKVSTNNIKKENDFIEIKIENDGPTIKDEDLHNIFEPFFTKGKKHGTGLGLASTQRIINLHLGEIAVFNKKDNNGVIFKITLPSSEVNDQHIIKKFPTNLNDIILSSSKQEFKSKIDGLIDKITKEEKSYEILLLEDEALYRAAVKELINSHERLKTKITIFDANNVEDAISLVKEINITHAIVDIDLGEVENGFDFLKYAQKNNDYIRILIHSNRCIKEDIELGKKLGAKGFVSKPLNIENLVNFLAEIDLFEIKDKL